MLADQFCAIDLACVRELLGYMNFTPTPGAHPAILGMLELRGRTMRLIDLRIRFGLPPVRTDETVMMIVEMAGETIALVTDNTVGIEKPGPRDSLTMVQPSRIDPRFVQGSMNVGDRVMVIVDLAKAITIDPPLPKAA